ncbi:MAG TPA: aminotransferase class V-fold PLP-dependent enzyme [Pirellulales bacterium]|jgi:selenocysteine lyase/cysteine desulfurase|nr:aminotransferase class V-fold PLP-dependent enzyme [Pirellulales bacterium]
MTAELADDPKWDRFRRQMPVVGRWAYFDHAAVSPLPRPSADTVVAWAEEQAENGVASWLKFKAHYESLRTIAAQLVGGIPEEIALLRSTTEGINIVAEGFPWQSGDNVVTLADEFPANLYPWINQAYRGVETRRVPTDNGRVDLNRLADACDERTRILTISWVGYASGWRNDLAATAEIAHRRGALLFVDAIQALGTFPIHVHQLGIDFLAAGGQKWMLGPEAAGLFFIRREHLDRLRVPCLGHGSMTNASDYTRIEIRLKDTAARFEGAATNMVGFLGLAASLELLLELGAESIGRRILALTGVACRRLGEIGAVVTSHRDQSAHNSGIVRFNLPGRDLAQAARQLLQRGVVLSVRGGGLRISPHAYTNEADISRLTESLREIMASG